MKYAIPVSGGVLSPHFGHCEQFALFDVDETSKEITRSATVDSPGHQPGFLPSWLSEQGVSMVIAGGMGTRAIELFQQNRIQVIVGATETNPERAVLSHLQGNLATGQNVCDH